MADPRSYAGTVLPSGGVDPLRLMGQIQASKAKANKPQSPTALPEIKTGAFLDVDKPIIAEHTKKLHATLAGLGPNVYLTGTPEREKYLQGLAELNATIEQAKADRDAAEKYQAMLNQSGVGAFWEEDIAYNDEQLKTPVTKRQGMRPVNRVVDVTAALEKVKLEPTEWQTSEPTDGGAYIKTTSGRYLPKVKLTTAARLVMGDPQVSANAERNAERLMQTDPAFAKTVEENLANGYTPGTTLVTEYLENKAFGDSKVELKGSGSGFGAGDVSRSQVVADKLSAISLGQGQMFGFDAKAKEDLLLNFEDARRRVDSEAHKLRLPLDYTTAQAGEDADMVGVELLEGYTTTGRYAYNPKAGEAYFQVVDAKGKTFDWIPVQQNNLPYSTFFKKDGDAVLKAGTKYILEKGAFDQKSGVTYPKRIITTPVPATGTKKTAYGNPQSAQPQGKKKAY